MKEPVLTARSQGKEFVRVMARSLGWESYAKKASFWISRRRPTYIRRERQAIQFYAQFIHSGDLVFDVGANIGDRTSIFLKLGATVVAVEPVRECFEILQTRFGRHPRVSLVNMALGSEEGEREIFTCEAHTLSSLSEDWIRSVQMSGRFADKNWKKGGMVTVTTLDRLIAEYGIPSFCKIDVEGFELEVLRGLCRPPDAVSFEFVKEFFDAAIACIQRLSGLATYAFNYTNGESMTLALPKWITAEDMQYALRGLPSGPLYGDVYSRRVHD